jgi:hypothetical protein
MDKKFKGKPGGDPSRRPPLVSVVFNCLVCGKEGSAETRKPEFFVAPKTCSTECSSSLTRREAQDLIIETLGEVPSHGSIPQNMAVELLAAQDWMKQAESGRVRKVSITCAHCGQPAYKFTHVTASNNKNVSRFCSGDCKESSLHGLPFGAICRSPRKAAQTTYAAAVEAATEMNIKLHLEGDTEGVQPYECACGNWHVGHRSKRIWLDAARVVLAIVTDKTVILAK